MPSSFSTLVFEVVSLELTDLIRHAPASACPRLGLRPVQLSFVGARGWKPSPRGGRVSILPTAPSPLPLSPFLYTYITPPFNMRLE